MKALVYDQYTIDDDFSKILKIKDIPSPEPKSGEVVFKVKVAALNYDDVKLESPADGLQIPNTSYKDKWTLDWVHLVDGESIIQIQNERNL